MGQQLQTRSVYSKPEHMVALSNWDVGLSVLPMSSVAPKEPKIHQDIHPI